MKIEQIHEAVSTRAGVRISERNGWAAGVEGIAMGYRDNYDSLKVGFVDAEGKYTGEYTTVPRESVELIKAIVWYRTNDDRHVLVHIEDPSFGIEGFPSGRCESPLAEIAPPLVEGDTRRLCPTCALTDEELQTTRTMFHRFGS
ncbi:hypothetical protein ACFXKF_36725 [Streptomyces scopuliridis]|uniref:hypothetical protein n=1 Tax=Streptomyces scopuliridis TaxID=452529 RepID=UPI0036C55BB5